MAPVQVAANGAESEGGLGKWEEKARAPSRGRIFRDGPDGAEEDQGEFLVQKFGD